MVWSLVVAPRMAACAAPSTRRRSPRTADDTPASTDSNALPPGPSSSSGYSAAGTLTCGCRSAFAMAGRRFSARCFASSAISRSRRAASASRSRRAATSASASAVRRLISTSSRRWLRCCRNHSAANSTASTVPATRQTDNAAGISMALTQKVSITHKLNMSAAGESASGHGDLPARHRPGPSTFGSSASTSSHPVPVASTASAACQSQAGVTSLRNTNW